MAAVLSFLHAFKIIKLNQELDCYCGAVNKIILAATRLLQLFHFDA